MSRYFSRRVFGSCRIVAFLFLAVALNSAFAGETTIDARSAAYDKTISSDVSNPAKNLARMNCGATIEVIGPDGRIVSVTDKDSSARDLLLDDDTLNYPLPEGDTTFIFWFPRTSTLDRFTFVNENAAAAGEMTVAVSNYRLPAQSRKWNEVSGRTSFTGKRLFDLSLLGTEARFVKLSFHVTKGGSIAALGLYGEQSLQKFAARQRGVIRVTNSAATRRLEDMLNFNFANLYARARIVFISSGMEEYARRMIDDNVATAFEFAPADPHPTVIVELAERERLHRVSAVYKMEKGRLDVFLLQDLGANPGDLSGPTPIASVTDTDGGGKAALDFDPHGARYVALRWTPAVLEARTTADSKDSQDLSDVAPIAKGPHGFEVAEVSAFGEMPLSMLSTLELPDVYADNFAGLKSPPLVVQAPVLPVVSE
jgi:hypothetical protein